MLRRREREQPSVKVGKVGGRLRQQEPGSEDGKTGCKLVVEWQARDGYELVMRGGQRGRDEGC